jgi:hypothetical protein
MMMKRTAMRRSKDWRLNFRLRKLCMAPAQALCPSVLEVSMSTATASEDQKNASVLDCLKEHVEQIDVAACKTEVETMLRMSLSDIRNDAQVRNRARPAQGRARVTDIFKTHTRVWAELR